MLSQLKKITLLFVLAITIQSCGFSAIYGEYSELKQKLAAVSVKKIDFGKTGQEFQTELEDLLNPTKADVAKTKYSLVIKLNKRRDALIIEQDREITRYNLILAAEYKLIDSTTGNEISSGTEKVTGSYDAVESDFATFTVEEDTLKRVTKELAKVIRQEVVGDLR